MEKSITIVQLIRKIRKLKADKTYIDPNKWYRTQKEHWLGWLGEYDGPGAYGHLPKMNRDAKFVYNHIVEPKMLAWLIEASRTRSASTRSVRSIIAKKISMQQKSAAIRKLVPWADLAGKLFGKGIK